jgi:hypothetical protein
MSEYSVKRRYIAILTAAKEGRGVRNVRHGKGDWWDRPYQLWKAGLVKSFRYDEPGHLVHLRLTKKGEAALKRLKGTRMTRSR